MNILINGKFLTQKTTGVQRFAIEITKELIKINPALKIGLPKGNYNIYKEFKDNLQIIGNNKGTLWEQIDLYFFAKKHKLLLINLCNTAPLFYSKNYITIHDLGVYENASWYSWKFSLWYKIFTPIIVKKAIHIFTVSNTSKDKIHSLFKISKNKITVTYNGIATKFISEIKEKNNIQKENIILHVGTFSKRKNIDFILNAFEKSNIENYKLVLCGSKDENLNFDEILNHKNNIELISNLSDAELIQYYEKSKYLISASYYEGFGLPILEGIYFNCQVILSKIPVYEELFYKESLFFNIQNINELVTIFKKIDHNNIVNHKIDTDFYQLKYNFVDSALKIWEKVQH